MPVADVLAMPEHRLALLLKPINTTTRPLLTTRQLAAELQVTERTLIKWRAAGLPHVKFSSRCIRHNLAAVLKYLSNKEAAR